MDIVTGPYRLPLLQDPPCDHIPQRMRDVSILRVHDGYWFADGKKRVLHSSVTIANQDRDVLNAAATNAVVSAMITDTDNIKVGVDIVLLMLKLACNINISEWREDEDTHIVTFSYDHWIENTFTIKVEKRNCIIQVSGGPVYTKDTHNIAWISNLASLKCVLDIALEDAFGVIL